MTVKELKYLCINYRDIFFLQFEIIIIIINVLVSFFRFSHSCQTKRLSWIKHESNRQEWQFYLKFNKIIVTVFFTHLKLWLAGAPHNFKWVKNYFGALTLNPLTAKLFNLNFHPLQVVSRLRDPQLQVRENYSDLTKWMSTFFQILLVDVTFYLSYIWNVVLNVLIKNENPNICGTGG